MSSTARQSQGKRSRILARDYVHDSLPHGPRFADGIWDFADLARQSSGERRIDIDSIPAGYRETSRVALLVLGRPTHPAIVAAGIVRRGRPAPLSQLVHVHSKLRIAAEWGILEVLKSWSSWSQSDLDRFVAALEAGTHRPSGEALNSTTVRGYVSTFKFLHETASILPDPLTFAPYPHTSAMKIAKEVARGENTTPPIPWTTWAPLVRAAWILVAHFGADILAAHGAAAQTPVSSLLSRGASGRNGLHILRNYFDSGGLLPLSTGMGRGSHKRGSVARSMLMRKAGISKNILTPSHESYLPAAEELLTQALTDGRTEFGGLIKPTISVHHSDGSTSPWVSEIGLAETEYFDSVLRAACYILIAALSGMRDSELQDMQRGCVGEEDGLTVLYSTQFKGEANAEGRARYWWAPDPVIFAVRALEELTPHEFLFARARRTKEVSEGVGGAYDPTRDIRRLIEFVNGDPQERYGRGNGLGLEPIVVPPGMAITQMSLRRSYSVYVVTTPEAEMGLGQQLGHWSLRTTTPYASDGMQRAVQMVDEQRRAVVQAQVAALIHDPNTPIAGEPASTLMGIRAQIIVNPERADALEQDAAERYHLGITNDCFFRPATAACGTDGPHLATHFCASDRCSNAVFHPVHIPVMERQIERIDERLEIGRLHPAFVEDMIYDRALLVQHLRTLNTKEEA